MGLWNEEDGFFYDVLKLPDGNQFPMKIRSMVGLIPSVRGRNPGAGDARPAFPDFKRRLEWFIENRPDLTENIACMTTEGKGERRLLSIADPRPAARAFSSTCWTNASFFRRTAFARLSQFHRDHPYTLNVNDMEHRVDYEPGESTTGLFGGNSNWRGPIWFPTELSAGGVAAEVSPLPRRRLQGRVPDRVGKDDDLVGGGGRAVAPHDQYIPARRERTPPCLAIWRNSRPIRMARSGPLSRVLPTAISQLYGVVLLFTSTLFLQHIDGDSLLTKGEVS